MTPHSRHARQFYINGSWVAPVEERLLPVINPSTEEVITEVALGSTADVDKAVAAARTAFASYSETSPAERLALIERIMAVYQRRAEDIAQAVSAEMGAPIQFARDSQTGIGLAHLGKIAEVLKTFAFEKRQGSSLIRKEPVGVVGLITPWNWPLNQITTKVGPALAAGCTMILKPSEVAPLNALIFAEIMAEAGVPKGVFNLVNGDGPGVGTAISAHPGIDMVSFTGSTRAGILVAKTGADTVKRIHQELGGKSPNLVLDDAKLGHAITRAVQRCFGNSGQSCNAATRLLVPEKFRDEVVAIARRAADAFVTGPAHQPGVTTGPVVSELQFNKIQALIQKGLDEGATLVVGGPGLPQGLNRGYFVKPTIFADVTPGMTIAREEIFGPVLSILTYKTEDEAIAMANDTVYGLAAYIQTSTLARGRAVAKKLRTGNVYINDPAWDAGLPFGGYKQSGNGREYGEYGLEDYLEIKGIAGWDAA